MNIKKNFIAFISLSILILSILNIKNPEKIKVYLFTSEIKELSLGNLITIAFFSGLTISTLLTLISKNNSNESSRDYFLMMKKLINLIKIILVKDRNMIDLRKEMFANPNLQYL